MRFALLGDHPDGLDMAQALVECGRYELTAYSGPALGLEYLRRWGASPRVVPDVEEILADPLVELVLVAGRPGVRAAQLRRALQSERHVLCVHPADASPDLAYEAGLLRQDSGKVLLPLLAEAFHPGIRRLAELARSHGFARSTAIAAEPLSAGHESSAVRLLEIERWSTEDVLVEAREDSAALPGWDTLRSLGGDIGEILALTGGEQLEAKAPVLVSGQFVQGGLFQLTLLPQQAESRLRLALVTTTGRAEILFPHGWPGAAKLTYRDDAGSLREEAWDATNPWPALVARFEQALQAPAQPAEGLSWQEEIRALELDDAARRSVLRRRASTLDYIEATEEASFKGTMTLVGCSILWMSLVLLILSVWLPWLGWFILPVFGVFLILQLLRFAVPPTNTPPPPTTRRDS